MLAATAWGVFAIVLFDRWSSRPGWHDMHRWAVSFGVLIVSMAAGYSGSSGWPKMDLIAKIVLNVIALAGMVALASKIRRRNPLALPR